MELLEQRGGTARVEVATDIRLDVARSTVELDSVPATFGLRLFENAAIVAALTDGASVNGAGYPPREPWQAD
jgi:hypothetical protein